MSVHLALMIESITSTYLAEDNCLKEEKEEEEKKENKKVNKRLFLIHSFIHFVQI
jgi:hypothetical protein